MNEYTPKIGLILADAGYKSLSIYPIVKALESNNIPIELIAATGSSAVMISMIKLGFSLDEIIDVMNRIYDYRKIFEKFDSTNFLSFLPYPFASKKEGHTGICTGNYLKGLLKEVFGKYTIQDIQPQLIIQATELYTIEGVALTEGPLDEALYASNAMYPFLPPIVINNQELLSGMYSYSLPLLPALKKENLDIAACLLFEVTKHLPEKNFFDFYLNLFNRSYTIGQRSQLAMGMIFNENLECIFHEIKFIKSFSIWDPQSPAYILQKGEYSKKRFINDLEVNIENIRFQHDIATQ